MKFKLVTVVMVLLISAGSFCWGAGSGSKLVLPKVLIIGDSISLGYTPYVKKILKNKAEVKHCQGNAGPTISGVDNIDRWLGDTKWDVVFFNWGLWDMYGWRYAKDDRKPAKYEERLEKLVARLEKTGAKLIWATTTPVCPDAEVTMHKKFKTDVVVSAETEQLYLDAAARVMKKHKVAVCDLHSVMLPLRNKYTLGPDNVHYTSAGYQKLASQVAAAIEKSLPKTNKTIAVRKINN